MSESRLEKTILQQWYKQQPGWSRSLTPLSAITRRVAARRYRQFRQSASRPPVPLLVVGNITVGGTGKTPLVIALCNAFQQAGQQVVVISRGYGAKAANYPTVVTSASDVRESGDEPLLIATRTGAPVIIDPDRHRAMQKAVSVFSPDIIISDDGLQHYRLPRTAELVVLDGERGLGNGLCLPAGPLRESAERLDDVDWVVINGGDFNWPGSYRMQLQAEKVVNLANGEQVALPHFADQKTVHAIAGIGNPRRFFSGLELAGLPIQCHAFSDHHDFTANDINFADNAPVIMTEKDAVKCRHIAGKHHWYLPVTAQIEPSLVAAIRQTLLETDS